MKFLHSHFFCDESFPTRLEGIEILCAATITIANATRFRPALRGLKCRQSRGNGGTLDWFPTRLEGIEIRLIDDLIDFGRGFRPALRGLKLK